jgi:hypothetical protein
MAANSDIKTNKGMAAGAGGAGTSGSTIGAGNAGRTGRTGCSGAMAATGRMGRAGRSGRSTRSDASPMKTTYIASSNRGRVRELRTLLIIFTIYLLPANNFAEQDCPPASLQTDYRKLTVS